MSADGTEKTGGVLNLLQGPADIETAVTLASDLVLVISPSGVIESLRTNSGLQIPQSQINDWVGRDVRETLTIESAAKLDARVLKTEAPIIEAMELNHGDSQNMDYPIRYACARMADGRILMLGRDLQAVAEIQQDLTSMQLELERERQNQRQFETKYRLLMRHSSDAIVLIDADSERIVDANPAILDLLGEESGALTGKKLRQLFDIDGDDLSALFSGGSRTSVKLAHKGSGRCYLARGAIYRVVNDRVLLCRISEQSAGAIMDRDLADTMTSYFVDSNDSIVITQTDGSIITANDSFLRLANVSDVAQLKNDKLERYLARGLIDLKIILKTVNANRHIKRYQTSLRDVFGAEARVDINGTQVSIQDRSCIIFMIHEARGRAPAPQSSNYLTEEASNSIAGLIGGVDLKNIVSDTTEVVERMCIDIALEMTKNNRVAAADMLGLSRQSLYVKIKKYGL